jgi:hypothetical protein
MDWDEDMLLRIAKMLRRWRSMFQPAIGLQVDGITARLEARVGLPPPIEWRMDRMMDTSTGWDNRMLDIWRSNTAVLALQEELTNLGCNDLFVCSKSQELALKPSTLMAGVPKH